MENKKGKMLLSWLIIIILVLIIILAFKNNSKKVAFDQSSNAKLSTTQDIAKEDNSKNISCENSAKAYFQNFIAQEDKPTSIKRTTKILERSYKSNLSDTRNRCYIEIIEKVGDTTGWQFLTKNIFDVDGAPNPKDYKLKDTYYASLGVEYLSSGAINVSPCITSLNPDWQIGGSDLSSANIGSPLVSKCNSLEEFDSKAFDLYGVK